MPAQTIDIALVLGGVYVALSLATSWLQEQVAAILKLRANTLAKGVKELVSSDESVFAALKAHPLIASATSEARLQFPSYIASRNFTLAFWQSLAMTIKDVAGTGVGAALANPDATLSGLIADVNGWVPTEQPAKDVKWTAIALLTSAEGDYDRLLRATDAWFDAQMDRVSGWYKRNAQYVLVLIAFAIAFGAGIDSIDICRKLYAEPAFAQLTAQSVADAVRQHQVDLTTDAGSAAVAKVIMDAPALQVVRPLWLPSNPYGGASAKSASPATSASLARSALLQRLAGMFITAIAASLGAPFWFDVLKGLVNVRMAGNKPSTSADATSENGKSQ